MISVPVYQVDAFAEKPFSGNPAAICLLENEGNEAWMQKVAQEMNLSETAFVTYDGETYNLRWFTPKMEVDLCGHATLAAAHVLFSERHVNKKNVKFKTKSGSLTASLTGKNNDYIEISFPVEKDEPLNDLDDLIKALRINHEAVNYIGKNSFDYLVEVVSEKKLGEIAPDFKLLSEITDRGVIVTSKSRTSPYDFVSRFFAPAVGIDEDPVTGSAHCNLAYYWKNKLNKSQFLAYQDSDRGGELRVRIESDKDLKERVYISGKAITVMKGELLYL
ncbi:PhzF family phenazine biosynthesis protein [Natranaerobius trueperi]|uniref:Isomerase n=1 Tax=Natranaerobius trueperi TaxID=759412 RepID=A0A226BZI7_9FIRM|nr:PhzF family phenazine biosynthesis isomerase [Natranaerobius trueperi]OWZ83540.1 isomerase [Natranaerobius trueperi]